MALEEKYIERLVANEQSTKSAHKRIDEAETRLDALEKNIRYYGKNGL